MEEYSTYVGLDVDIKGMEVGLSDSGRGSARLYGRCGSDTASLRKLVKSVGGNGKRVSFCYEAGPSGYDLYRKLRGLNQDCIVVAPSLIPRKAGERVKTNRRDALSLSRLHRAGELTAVWVPGEEQESIRDLTRAREDAKHEQRRAKQHLLALLLRRGKLYGPGRNWTKLHFEWLAKTAFSHRSQQMVFNEHVDHVIRCGERVAEFEEEMRAALKEWSLRPLVEAFMALHGVEMITAMTIAAELGELWRFDAAPQLMSYVGFVPRENSTGDSHRRGSITKTGNAHVRRVLVEAAWTYRLPPRRSGQWWKRAQLTSKEVASIAWKARRRLHKRYWALSQRKKLSQKIAVAVARELCGFIWAIGQEVRIQN